MTLRSRFDQDYDQTYCAIEVATEELAKSMPIELIARALLVQARLNLACFTDMEQWELVKEALLDLRSDFEVNAERYWSNVIDPEQVEENYNKRYG